MCEPSCQCKLTQEVKIISDSNDLVIAKGRLQDYNKMIDLAVGNWDTGRPACELLCFITTACHINELLIGELGQALDGMAVPRPPAGTK